MKKAIGIIFFLVVWISGYFFYSRIENASQPPKVATLKVKLTKIEQSVSTEALLFSREVPVISPAAGKVQWLKRERERVRKGAPIARAGGKILLAKGAGILLHSVDEVTGVWDFETAWQKGWITPPVGRPMVFNDGDFVKKGVPIGRIFDNIFFYILVRLKKDDFSPRWYDRRRITIAFPHLKREEKAKLVKIKPEGRYVDMLLRLVGWDELCGLRCLKIKLIKRKLRGAVIPANAIIIKEGKSGVYLVKGGRVFFKEIRFKNLSSAVAITPDLKEGDRIVVEPDRVKEGMFIRW